MVRNDDGSRMSVLFRHRGIPGMPARSLFASSRKITFIAEIMAKLPP